jgi:hypothetical protein
LSVVTIPRDEPKGYIQRVALGLMGFLMFGYSLGYLGMIANDERFRPFLLLILGFMMSTLGQMGDLTLSSIKRDLGVKDLGGILPGHGGLLDRVDSLVLVVPPVFHYLCFHLGALGSNQATCSSPAIRWLHSRPSASMRCPSGDAKKARGRIPCRRCANVCSMGLQFTYFSQRARGVAMATCFPSNPASAPLWPGPACRWCHVTRGEHLKPPRPARASRAVGRLFCKSGAP